MYAVRLPEIIPPAGLPGGPPLAAEYHYFAGMHPGDFDMRSVIFNCIRDPQQLQPTMDYFQATMQNYIEKR
jgi:hypothetical protein